jgi:2-C-methyl-D-erythritol 2,4-cyclodiphosphate synthase
MRIGCGYDVHRLVEGRKLILGGVEIDFECGLLGHSDADVLVHAVCDAVLGALGEGDLGRHFPDSDAAYADISSLEIFHRVVALMLRKGYGISNIDATVIAQRPKLAPYIDAMKKRLAAAGGFDEDRINIKATTTEGLGFAGRGEGIAAEAVVLLLKA